MIEKLIEGVSVVQKQLTERMYNVLLENAPQTYYMNPYELAQEFGFKAEEWERLITHEPVETYIKHRIIKMTEYDARKALFRLSNDPALSSQDVSAIKELLMKSKMFDVQETNNQVVLMHIPMEEVTT